MDADDETLRGLSRARWRRALLLTAVMVAIYFGFIALAAWAKPLMSRALVPGLSLGILLGAIVIISAFVLTALYVRWANVHHDPELRRIRGRARAAESGR